METKQQQLTWLVGAILLLSSSTGCAIASRGGNAQQSAGDPSPGEGGPIAADVAIAGRGSLAAPVEYVGTTRPFKEVSLRSQVEGRLLTLNVDAGDRVARNQVLAQLDDAILLAEVERARAELATRESELAQARAQVSSAQTELERARVELQQAQNDAERYTQLARSGAVPQREAESYQTAARVANQALLSARDRVLSQEKAVESALGQVAAQRAAVAQQQQRQAYARLISPINGAVLEKVSEPGNLVSPGGEVLKLGDLSQIKIVVPVSELDLSDIRVGQTVAVTLDALPQQNFTGTVSRISPLADSTTRQVPVEVTLPNPNGQIGSGLLARVKFQAAEQQRVVVPQTAVQNAEGQGATAREGSGNGSPPASASSTATTREGSGNDSPPASASSTATIFAVEGQGDRATVEARTVRTGARAEGKVEILSGLQPGERFVVNSSQPLKDGDTIRPSILSE